MAGRFGEIVGWAFDGALYHDGCLPDHACTNGDEACDCESCEAGADKAHPIYSWNEGDPSDACDHCLHTWIMSTEPGDRSEAPNEVFIDTSWWAEKQRTIERARRAWQARGLRLQACATERFCALHTLHGTAGPRAWWDNYSPGWALPVGVRL